uniref:High mobility group protein HMGI-C n=1 Tax=Magallana gigas TaxID=29159 RepID=K1R8Q0_MAGGI
MEGGESSSTDKAAEEAPKRGRGRPRKEKTEEPDDAEPKPKRPRGRPKGTFKKPRPTEEKPKGSRGRPRCRISQKDRKEELICGVSSRSFGLDN